MQNLDGGVELRSRNGERSILIERMDTKEFYKQELRPWACKQYILMCSTVLKLLNICQKAQILMPRLRVKSVRVVKQLKHA